MIITALAGVRVLIVEDEPLIAFDVEQICLDHGAASTHIARSIKELDGVDFDEFDIAILDRSVGVETSHGIARRLQEHATPFIFSSGLYDEAERAEFPSAPFVAKPYSTQQLIEAMKTALAAAPSRV